jgi:hypothetical protein
MIIHCLYDKLVPVHELRPHPKNHNTHPRDQIERLAKILEYQGFRYPVKVSKLSGYITSGHGRLEAAKANGWTEVPVNFQDYEDETQEYADVQADNAIASWAALDLSRINADLGELGPDFDLDLLGIKDFTLDGSEKEQEENPYTSKIEIPIYEPKGEKPKVAELVDDAKTKTLIERINKAEGLPSDLKNFLLKAAERHLVFNYEKVAEYYAWLRTEANPAAELFEESALVIIDFDKAIENGFVKLTTDLATQYGVPQ